MSARGDMTIRSLARSRARLLAFVLLTTSALLSGALVASATVVTMGVPELAAASARVIEGTVTSATARRALAVEEPATVVTDYVVRVTDCIKGTAGAEIVYAQPGGTLGGQVCTVSDMPELEVGERVVIFQDARGRLVGACQGKVGVDEAGRTSLGVSLEALKAQVVSGTAPRSGTLGQRAFGATGRSLVTTPRSLAALPTEPVGFPFFDDFEDANMTGWTVEGAGGNPATWGAVDNWGDGVAYCAQTAIPDPFRNLPARYPENMDARMILGPFDLTDTPVAFLSLERYAVLGAGDRITVGFSTGEGWYGWDLAPTVSGPEDEVFDLRCQPGPAPGGMMSYCGEPRVYIMIKFTSDGSGSAFGAFVDDVRVDVPDITAERPVIGGIGDTLTVNGTGFGTGMPRASYPVYFYTDSTDTHALTWSDTQATFDVGRTAGSGVMQITWDYITRRYVDVEVVFTSQGRRWTNPTVTYFFNGAGSGWDAAESLFDAGATQWNGRSAFRFVDGGTTSATANERAGDCNVWFTNTLADGVLCQTSVTAASSGIATDADITFNANYPWGDGSSGRFDIQTVGANALGSALGLGNQWGPTDWPKVMCGGTWPGTRRRTLTASDISGARYLYGLPSGPPSGYFTVAEGAAQTSSAVVSVCSTAIIDAADMAFDPGDGWSASAEFARCTTLTLPGEDGTKTVLGRFSNATGAFDASATIVLDRGAPSGTVALASGAGTTTVADVTLDSSVTDTFTPEGSLSMRWSLNGGATWTEWTGYSASLHVILAEAGRVEVLVQYRDLVGNVLTLQDSIYRPAGVTPLAGADRYATAGAIARQAYPDWHAVRTVIVASGEDRAIADPLSAAGLAHAYDAPLLLVPLKLRTRGPRLASTSERLAELDGPTNIIVVGGPVAVPAAIIRELRRAAKGGSVVQLSGANRYGTAKLVFDLVKARNGGAAPSDLLIANGATTTGYYDALALSPISSAQGFPLLLVNAKGVPGETAAALASAPAARRWVAGNRASVPDAVVSAVGATRVPGTEGADRFGVAASVADWAIEKGWLSWSHVAVANKLPDALTGGVLIGREGGSLLYTDWLSLNGRTRTCLSDHMEEITCVWVFGGDAVVHPTTRAAMASSIR